MSNSQEPITNVIPINQSGLTSSSDIQPESSEPTAHPVPDAVYQKLMRHLEHASAEINTACAEGFYVHMLTPVIRHRIVSLELDPETNTIVNYDIDFDVELRYKMEPLDAKRVKRVDHRDEMTKFRSPDWQTPPGG